MENLLQVIKGANVCYVVLNILLLIMLFLFLKTKRIDKVVRIIIFGVALILSIVMFSYMNTVVSSIFNLKYLSVKTYLVIVIASILISLWTINNQTKLIYKVLNFALFGLMTIIFGATSAVLLGNRFDTFYIMDVANAVNFIDLSMVIFMIYLILLSVIYIGDYFFFHKKELLEEELETEVFSEIPKKIISKIKNIHIPKVKVSRIKKEKKKEKKQKKDAVVTKEQKYLSPEELLNYNRQDGFYIHGVECSIIFEDSNQENIVKNYYILLQDIKARLVNGYTLEENRMLKGICQKLQVSNLGSVDINNVSLLNKISVDEYMLLRRVLGVN